MQQRKRVVVVGGDAAGMSAASQAGRQCPNLQIVAFERGAFTSYSACGMPYYVGGIVNEVEQLIARTPEEHRRGGIDARIQHEVEEIDSGQRRVRVRRRTDGAAWWEAFDDLVIATGASPTRPNLPASTPGGSTDLRSSRTASTFAPLSTATRPSGQS